METNTVPYIDPSVKYVGVSKLRGLDRKALRNVDNTLVIQDGGTPLAVLLNYETYLIMQNKLREVMDTVEILCDQEEFEQLISGLKEAKEGRAKTIDEIRRSLGHIPEE